MTKVLIKIKRRISKIVKLPGGRPEPGFFSGDLMAFQCRFEDPDSLLCLDEPQQKKKKLKHPESSARRTNTIRMK